jgi:hypothetical protein
MYSVSRSPTWTYGIEENTGEKQIDVTQVHCVVCSVEFFSRL